MRFVVTSPYCFERLLEMVVAKGLTDVVVRSESGRNVSERTIELLQNAAPTSVFCIDLGRDLVQLIQSRCKGPSSSVLGPFSWKNHQEELASWLTPPVVEGLIPIPIPSVALNTAAETEPLLVLAISATANADRINPSLHGWVAAAAEALRAFASEQGELHSEAGQFFTRQRPDIDFATSGNVRFSYRVTWSGGELRRETKRHLLLRVKGWRPKPEVPRIYFDTVRHLGSLYTVVLYCGPHPPENSVQSADIHLPG
ncbi:MAG: hypothetical protein ACKVZ0_15670 [Gemmatimonadales bacterium]